jgi:hypothetical protein
MEKVTPRGRVLAALCLAAYAVLVIAAVLRHEPWADEAQSWLLARDSGLVHLWGTLLHYEGTPGLWQTLVHALIGLGLRYSGYNFVSVVLALAAVYLLVRYAPFPLFIRLLLPFTYYLCYQYAVIARSYALIAPLLFAIAAIYPQTKRRPWLTTTLLCLLAGVSVHGFLISVCIWLTLFGPLILRAGAERKQLAITGLIYSAVLVFFLVSAWPAKDVAFAEHRGLSNLRLLPEVTKAGITGAFTGYWVPSLVLIALSLPILWRGGGWLFFLLSTAAFCLFGTIVYAQLWHFGMVFLAWLFAIWISTYKSRLDAPALLALIVAIAFQCYWTASAIRYDWSHAYSGSLQASQYLRQSGIVPGEIYAIGYPSVAVQPYFPANIYSDYHRGAYWDWSKRNTADDPAALIASNRRELVLVGYKNITEKQRWANFLALLGYSPVQHFDGSTFWQTHVFELESCDLYRQTSLPRFRTTVTMNDPSQAGQLLSGFYDIEGKSRWTAQEFSVLLKAAPGAQLVLRIFIPDVQIQNLGPMTMTASAGSQDLPSRTFSKSGDYTYAATLPTEVLGSGLAVVRFRLDKSSVGLNGDARELGVSVTEVGFQPQSPGR